MNCSTIHSSNIHLLECHKVLDRLKKLDSPVGEGQFGKVYILDDLNYAIKVIPKKKDDDLFSSDSSANEYDSEDNYESEDNDEDNDDEEGTSEEEFVNEVDSLARVVSCPNVIKYYGYYEDNNYYYLVTEAIRGKEIKNKSNETNNNNNNNNNDKRLEFVKQIVKGLQCIHESGVAHNDISLSNIMYDAGKDMYFFIDFGLSCSADCDGVYPGSDYYKGPEFTNNNYTKSITLDKLQKNDLWALGLVILQEILWFYKDGKTFKRDGDIWYELDFATQSFKQRKDVLQIMKETIPRMIKLASAQTNNNYITDLLTSLLKINPHERSLL